MSNIQPMNIYPCPKCSNPYPSGAKYCEKCGAKLFIQCPNIGCKFDIDIHACFCPKCGVNIEQKSQRMIEENRTSVIWYQSVKESIQEFEYKFGETIVLETHLSYEVLYDYFSMTFSSHSFNIFGSLLPYPLRVIAENQITGHLIFEVYLFMVRYWKINIFIQPQETEVRKIVVTVNAYSSSVANKNMKNLLYTVLEWISNDLVIDEYKIIEL